MQTVLRSVVLLMLTATLAMAQPAGLTTEGPPAATQGISQLLPNARIGLVTVDLARFTGELVSMAADGVEMRVTEGRRSGEIIKVPLPDIRKIALSQGKGGRAWSAARGAFRMAMLLAPLFVVWGLVDYEDLEYGSPGAAAAGGLGVAAILGGVIGGAVGAAVPAERWKTVSGMEYRPGVVPRRPTVPYRFVSVRGGWNGQSRKEATDPPEVPNDGLSGGAGAIGFTAGFRVSHAARLEVEFWRPERIAVSPETIPGEEPRSFRDYALGLSVVSEFKTSERVRPYWVMGIGAIRVDEQGLSERTAYGGLVSGIGAEVNVGRHLAIAPEVRVNYPIDFWYVIDPYEKRFSLRPSIGMVVRF
jgi:hypothetical protein